MYQLHITHIQNANHSKWAKDTIMVSTSLIFTIMVSTSLIFTIMVSTSLIFTIMVSTSLIFTIMVSTSLIFTIMVYGKHESHFHNSNDFFENRNYTSTCVHLFWYRGFFCHSEIAVNPSELPELSPGFVVFVLFCHSSDFSTLSLLYCHSSDFSTLSLLSCHSSDFSTLSLLYCHFSNFGTLGLSPKLCEKLCSIRCFYLLASILWQYNYIHLRALTNAYKKTFIILFPVDSVISASIFRQKSWL
jgi:hypothetical protein